MAFHSRPNYGYRFILKQLAEKFEKQLTCLGENSNKYIIFTEPKEIEVRRVDKNGEQITKNISYRLQFTDSASLMAKFIIKSCQ